MARFGALPLAVLAAGWLGLGAFRRRAELFPATITSWRAVAAGGLALSAVLHAGLVPVYSEGALSRGIFYFSIASAVPAVAGAVVLAWPSRPAYLLGLVGALVPSVLRALVLGAPTSVYFVGLLVIGAQLVAAVACVALWLRAPRRRSKRKVMREPAADGSRGGGPL